MHVKITYPTIESERQILQLARQEAATTINHIAPLIHTQQILDARKEVLAIYMSDAVEEYIVQLIMATREPTKYNTDLANWIEYGASPRATIALDRCSRAHAWLKGKEFVSPDDVQAVIYEVLRHRLILSFEAEASGINTDHVIGTLLKSVPTV